MVTNLSCPKCHSFVEVYYPSEETTKENYKKKRRKNEKSLTKQIGGNHYKYFDYTSLQNLLTKISCFLQKATL